MAIPRHFCRRCSDLERYTVLLAPEAWIPAVSLREPENLRGVSRPAKRLYYRRRAGDKMICRYH